MSRSIITISREFGSGGRTIGKLVAEKLDIPYYDKELVKQVALKTGFHESYIERAGEEARATAWLGSFLGSRGVPGAMNGLSAEDFLWTMQYQVIQNLAKQGPCVIVGRCADYILRERGDCFHVFIHADPAFRADRIVRLYGESEKNPESRLEEKDKRRRIYYKHYTDREWGMSQNYHLSLDSGLIGVETCADLIIRLAEQAQAAPNHTE